MQRLILPINQAKVTASWKTDAYRQRFGCVHYGVDMVSSQYNRLLYASGDGSVLAAGYDRVLGNFVVIRYQDACDHRSHQSADVICRMWHLASVSVLKGKCVSKDTVLGYYGSTGQLAAGAHLHLEVDRDISRPMHTPSLSGKSDYFHGTAGGATDRTMTNPLNWLHCKPTAPDYQTYTTVADSFVRAEDRALPAVT